MKKLLRIMTTFTTVLLFSFSLEAATFNSGSTGADGAFNPPTQVPPGAVIDTVNNIVTIPLPPTGVFNFTSVYVPAGMTVKFVRNIANTPVYILTSGDVNILGIIDVSGESGADGGPSDGTKIGPIIGGKGGPGGFDGGFGGEPAMPGVDAKMPGYGLGPGESANSFYGQLEGSADVGGCYATSGNTNYSWEISYSCYGNDTIQPLIGGSGGGGGTYCGGYPGCFGSGGGGGGGAILIASLSSIIINIGGEIRANGGTAGSGSNANGSGGAVKLIAKKVYVYGQITALGHVILPPPAACRAWCWNGPYALYMAGQGRIRIETYYFVDGATYPSRSLGMPGPVFLPQNPLLSIISIASTTVPSAIFGSYTTPDISLPSTITNPISISISAANIPVGTTINVSAVPQFGSPTATTATLAGTDTSSTATASLSISLTCPSVITVQTTFNMQTAMFYDGEKIEKVRVASTIGVPSKVTYITKSGKEIPSEILLAGLMK